MDPVIASIFSAVLGALIPLILYFRKTKAEAELTELQKIKLVLDEVQEERDKSKTWANTLEDRIRVYNGKIVEYESERKILINKLASHKESVLKLEKDNVRIANEAERQILMVKQTYKIIINRQNDKIKELERRINGTENLAREIKEDTRELKVQLRKTGQLPKLPKDK